MSGTAPIKNLMKLIIENEEVSCMPREVILFNIDTSHRGYSYDISCYRLFMKFGYYKLLEYLKENNSISFVQICQYYNFTYEGLNTLHSYQYYYLSNPKGKENCKRKAKKRKGRY